MREERRHFHGWYIVAVCAVISLLVGGIAMRAPSAFIPTGTVDNRQSFGFAVFLSALALAPLMLLIGWYVDRVGSKKVMLFGCLLAGAGMVAFAAVSQQLWLYAVLSVLIVAGASAASGIPLTILLLKWFKRRRGLAIALAFAATGAGAGIITFAGSSVPDGFARQVSAILIGIATLAAAILLIREYITDHPSEMGLYPDGIAPDEHEPAEPIGHTLKEAIRTPTFWYIAGATFLVNMFWAFPMWSLISHLRHEGASVAPLLATGGILRMAPFLFIPFIGLLADRRGATQAFVLIVFASAVGVGVFVTLPANWIFVGFPLLQMICGGGIAVLGAIIIAERHGMSNFGIIYAVIILLGGLGTTVGSVLLGLLIGYSFDQAPESTMGFRSVLALQIALLLLSAYLIRKTTPLTVAEPPPVEVG